MELIKDPFGLKLASQAMAQNQYIEQGFLAFKGAKIRPEGGILLSQDKLQNYFLEDQTEVYIMNFQTSDLHKNLTHSKKERKKKKSETKDQK